MLSYLPSFPYADDPELHVFAAMLSLQSAQAPVRASSESSPTSSPRSRKRVTAVFNPARLAEARKYFRAALDVYQSLELESNAPGPAYCQGILSIVS